METDSYPSLCINCGHGLVLISAPTGGFHTFHDSLDPVRSAVGAGLHSTDPHFNPLLSPGKEEVSTGKSTFHRSLQCFHENTLNFFWTKPSGPIYFALDSSIRIISLRDSDTTANRRRSRLKHFKATGSYSNSRQLE